MRVSTRIQYSRSDCLDSVAGKTALAVAAVCRNSRRDEPNSYTSRFFVFPNKCRAFEIACDSASSAVDALNLARHAPGETLSAWHTYFDPIW